MSGSEPQQPQRTDEGRQRPSRGRLVQRRPASPPPPPPYAPAAQPALFPLPPSPPPTAAPTAGPPPPPPPASPPPSAPAATPPTAPPSVGAYHHRRRGVGSVDLDEQGQLLLHLGSHHHRFDLANPALALRQVGTPGERGWAVEIARRNLTPVSITARYVDPAAFLGAVRRWRPEI